jgi:hypothetical protein
MVCTAHVARRVHRGADRPHARRPPPWHPLRALSAAAQAMLVRSRRARRFVFLRRLRHALVSAACQAALARSFQERSQGQPPVPPAPLALVTLWQAYPGASDDAAMAVPVTSRHGWNRCAICWRYSGPEKRWRRGWKCEVIGP